MQISQAVMTDQGQQKYLISGIVDFSTVPDLLRQSSVFFAAVKVSGAGSSDSVQITIDLAKIEECNSAALALMLEIVKSAQLKKLEVHFENLPATLSTIAKAYGVENEIRDLCR